MQTRGERESLSLSSVGKRPIRHGVAIHALYNVGDDIVPVNQFPHFD
jgi:hypothetical protein